jgi:hypothetical protein
MAGTTWNNFVPGRKAKASEVNENFEWLSGDVVPHNQGDKTDSAYFLGMSDYKWKGVHTYSINPSTTSHGVAIGKEVADNSSALDLSAFQKAIMFPKLTNMERDALSPQNGMMIWNDTSQRFERYEGGQWLAMNNPIGFAGKTTSILTNTSAYIEVVNIYGSGIIKLITREGLINDHAVTITIDGTDYSISCSDYSKGYLLVDFQNTSSSLFFSNLQETSFYSGATETTLEPYINVSFKNNFRLQHRAISGYGGNEKISVAYECS